MALTQEERISGGLWGLLIGDALGVPYEFHSPHDLPPLSQLEMQPPLYFERSHEQIPIGTWSDDGAQVLILLASLQRHNELNLEDFGKGLVDWYESGYMAVGSHVFDVGIQTAEAIRLMMQGVPAQEAGPKSEYKNGNGSLMRVLPLALWHRGTDEELVKWAHLQSQVTHGHLRSKVCCAVYCLWARRLLAGSTYAWAEAVKILHGIYGDASPEWAEFAWHVRPDQEPTGSGSGYVVDSLNSVRKVMQASTYEQVVKQAIALGHDTDTTACIAGGLAGIRDGVEAIPTRWMQVLRGQELVKLLLAKLLQTKSDKA
ncbi:ADP-ribosylglycohydrolase family protein [Thiofilum flexile]|uniref:ADP-ribosylglycohydrolase family protein n=1 Tax=Thiofilum flexile TaxID=125627 RepID=UPI000360DDF5|nr:ADP-ribosylglycohydrolase family protein [Thiofilum flexile]